MQIEIDDVVGRYNAEVARLTQRAVLAEARADATEEQLQELRATSAGGGQEGTPPAANVASAA